MVKYRLKDLFNLFAGGDIDIEHFSQYKTPIHCFPIYSNSLNNKGLYGYTSAPKYKGNSITITGRGSVGHAEYRKQDFDAIIRLLVLIPKKSNIVNSYYLTQFINQHVSFPLESTGVPQLTVPQIENIEVELPDFAEQATVAEALSDIESLIFSLQKLIEKKKAIKQGAMQELLTGKKRLPGFSGEWKKERLGDISDIKDGTHGTFQRVDRGYPLLSAKNVYNNHLDIAENESLISSEDYYSIIANGFPRKGDILLSCVGTIGRCCIYSGMPKVAFQRSVAFIRVKECVASYILQYMQSENANKQLLNSANASAQAGVYLGAISDIEVYMPCCVKEQQAIAQVLSDMDSEIEQQEKKLAKYQQIKQGMMQELLTGRIRLV